MQGANGDPGLPGEAGDPGQTGLPGKPVCILIFTKLWCIRINKERFSVDDHLSLFVHKESLFVSMQKLTENDITFES